MGRFLLKNFRKGSSRQYPRNCWALVVGATGEVGKACASSLSELGLGIIATGRDIERLENLSLNLGIKGNPCRVEVLDLALPGAVDALVSNLDAAALVPSVVVFCAGESGPLGETIKTQEYEWREVFEVNVLALITLLNFLTPKMVASKWGRLIYIGSVEAINRPRGGNAPYSTSKSAAHRYLAHLAFELDGTGVTVHSINPGEIKSNMWKKIKQQSHNVPALSRFSEWASLTERYPDDPTKAGEVVARLIDDHIARGLHGQFIWAQDTQVPVSLR